MDRLCAIDHDILGLLQANRVLTTPQLITLTARPERTIDYRLARLRNRSLVERTRPSAASGSAPFYWWLTRAGARVVEGTSPAPGKGTPNPLFLRHTAAIAGLYVALCDVGPNVGLRPTEWRRDEDAWEDWSSHRGTGRLRPDAYAELVLTVDGQGGAAGAFVEVDFATMDQARLRAKVARHRQYCTDTVWWDRHPCCPALLLVTTSETRVNRFLAGVEKDRPRPSPYEPELPEHYDELVVACAAVSSPEEAVVAPVWRSAVGDAPITLSALLAPEVRQYRRVVARVQTAQRQHDEYRRRYLVNDLAREWPGLAEAMGVDEASAAIRYLFEGPIRAINARENWGLAHLDLVEATAEWWKAARSDAMRCHPPRSWPPGAPSTASAGWPRPSGSSPKTRRCASATRGCADRPPRWQPVTSLTSATCGRARRSMGTSRSTRPWPNTSGAGRPRWLPACTRSRCTGGSERTGPISRPPTTPPTSSFVQAAPYPKTTTTRPAAAIALRRVGAVAGRSSRWWMLRSRRPSKNLSHMSLPAERSSGGADEQGD